MALMLRVICKKKKKKYFVLVLTCLNTVIVLNSLRLGVLLKVAMLLVLSLTSVLQPSIFREIT